MNTLNCTTGSGVRPRAVRVEGTSPSGMTGVSAAAAKGQTPNVEGRRPNCELPGGNGGAAAEAGMDIEAARASLLGFARGFQIALHRSLLSN